MRKTTIKASDIQGLSAEQAAAAIRDNFVFSLGEAATRQRLDNVANKVLEKAEAGDLKATSLLYANLAAIGGVGRNASTVNVQQNVLMADGAVIDAVLKIRERIVWMINDAPAPVDRAAIVGRLAGVPRVLIEQALACDYFQDSDGVVSITSVARRDVVEMPIRVAARAITGGTA